MTRRPANLRECPYVSVEALTAAIDIHGSRNAFARHMGVHWSVVARWEDELRNPLPVPGPVVAVEPDLDVAVRERIGRSSESVEELSDALDVAPRRIRECLDRLKAKGFRIEDAGEIVHLDRVSPSPTSRVLPAPGLFHGDRFRFAIVSDTHLGSKHDNVDYLHTAYRVIADEGIDTVYHPGDLVCGAGIYPGQIRSIRVHTGDEQVEYALEKYPVVDGVTTYIVGGNHDLEGAFGRIGFDPVRAFCSHRPDFVHCGDYDAWFEFPQGARMHMLHPKGGSSYAVSYKAQKLVEGYEGGKKPNLLLLGHYHRHGWFEARDVQVMLCGTLEGNSDLGKRLGLGKPSIGFWIVDLTIADDGSIVRMKPEWLPFYGGRLVR